MPRLPGRSIANCHVLTPDERLVMARAMGEGLAALHGALFDALAQYDPVAGRYVAVGTPYDGWFRTLSPASRST